MILAIAGFFLKLLSKRNSLFCFFFRSAKKVKIGMWSNASSRRYSVLPEGKRSDHALFAMAMSSLLKIGWLLRFPLQEKQSPECLRSNRSFSATKDLKLAKDPSVLSGPPLFSSFVRISLKSPVRNHGPSRSFAISEEIISSGISLVHRRARTPPLGECGDTM